MQKPVTRLHNAIDRHLKNWAGNGHLLISVDTSKQVVLTRGTLRRWRKWAASPDARGRQDGSKPQQAAKTVKRGAVALLALACSSPG